MKINIISSQEEFYGRKIQLADRETVEQNSGKDLYYPITCHVLLVIVFYNSVDIHGIMIFI